MRKWQIRKTTTLVPPAIIINPDPVLIGNQHPALLVAAPSVALSHTLPSYWSSSSSATTSSRHLRAVRPIDHQIARYSWGTSKAMSITKDLSSSPSSRIRCAVFKELQAVMNETRISSSLPPASTAPILSYQWLARWRRKRSTMFILRLWVETRSQSRSFSK